VNRHARNAAARSVPRVLAGASEIGRLGGLVLHPTQLDFDWVDVVVLNDFRARTRSGKAWRWPFEFGKLTFDFR
jgi:hypothetical protein